MLGEPRRGAASREGPFFALYAALKIERRVEFIE
jgi:hypothetical protein